MDLSIEEKIIGKIKEINEKEFLVRKYSFTSPSSGDGARPRTGTSSIRKLITEASSCATYQTMFRESER